MSAKFRSWGGGGQTIFSHQSMLVVTEVIPLRLIQNRYLKFILFTYCICKCKVLIGFEQRFLGLFCLGSFSPPRVKSGNLGHQVNSDIHLQTVQSANPGVTAPY